MPLLLECARETGRLEWRVSGSHRSHPGGAGAPVADERLQLLVELVRSIVSTRGWPDQSLVERFYGLGYTHQHYLEIVLGVTMKTLSNYINHAADTPVNEAFAA